jgi:hypothetical protein
MQLNRRAGLDIPISIDDAYVYKTCLYFCITLDGGGGRQRRGVNGNDVVHSPMGIATLQQNMQAI